MNEPLIYTSMGNLPIASLEYSTQWEDNPDFTKLTETYKHGGEVVRQSVHVFGRKTLDIGADQGKFA